MAEDRDRERELLGEEEEQDLLFRFQMAVANFVLGYWKHGLALLGLGLVGSFFYGLWQGHELSVQQEIQAAIARAERDLPDPEPGWPLGPRFDVSNPQVVARVEQVAKAIERAAEDGSGTGATMAWIEAGELWTEIGRKEEALRAFRRAAQNGGEGVVGLAAAARAARALAEAGEVDEAARLLEPLAAEGEGLVGERALYELAEVYRIAGREADARAARERLQSRFPDSSYLARLESELSGATAGAPAAEEAGG